jgi:hypothetical protein
VIIGVLAPRNLMSAEENASVARSRPAISLAAGTSSNVGCAALADESAQMLGRRPLVDGTNATFDDRKHMVPLCSESEFGDFP